ncbi:MAG TPA: autotransporter-associated beta strand repeat-containing protein [Terrimicrobiaceae bacterium]|nr:autotransporter-associated beta strand repeat-containing protein [Terrimicrobiaceae bacterium]
MLSTSESSAPRFRLIRKISVFLVAAVWVCGGLVSEIRAASYTWTGLGANDNWSDAGNWEGGPDSPGLGDTAEFASVTPRLHSVMDSPLTISGIAYSVPGYSLSVLAPLTITGGIAADSANGPELLVDGALSLGGDALVTSLSGTGSVSLDAHALTVSQSGTFSGTISGTGGSLVKSGTGTLTILGVGEYTGATTVAAGTLQVDGTIVSDVAVQDGAILGGDGLVGSIVLESGAVLIPVGCFDGEDLTWHSGATMIYDLGVDVGILELTGDLLKGSGSSFSFTFQDGDWQVGETYPLIFFNATTFAEGDFHFTNGGGFDGDFVLEENALRFTLTAVPEPSSGVLGLAGLVLACVCYRRARRD